ncbi:hypothetical protein ACFRCW_34360 [Streptomyces sp. NPDC056653]|uniref:hypothetical protein n=1 Tax=Streptomyces sp. NPDC056653 TaxID=3345894 RepID=UPI0036AC8CA7
MVEFRFLNEADRLVAHFYIVEDAEDQRSAQRIAARRAESASEQETRGWVELDRCCTRVQSLRRTLLGEWRLSAWASDDDGPEADGTLLTSRACSLVAAGADL